MKLGLIFSLFILPHLGFAEDPNQCSYTFNVSNPVIEIMSNSQVVEQGITISRGQTSADGRCKIYRVFFSKGLANSYQRKAYSTNGDSFNYNLHRQINQAGTLKEYGDAVSNNEFIQDDAPEKHKTYHSKFYVSVPGLNNQVVAAGTYSDVLNASVYGYNANSGLYLFDSTKSVTVVFYIAKNLQISLVDEGGAFDPSSTSKVLDFGYLTQNQEKGADLRVVSNGPYRLKVSSQNNGKLKRSQGNTISYSLRVNNQSVTLSSSATGPVSIGQGDCTSEAGDRYNLKVKITENTSQKAAGIYQDVITITAIAN